MTLCRTLVKNSFLEAQKLIQRRIQKRVFEKDIFRDARAGEDSPWNAESESTLKSTSNAKDYGARAHLKKRLPVIKRKTFQTELKYSPFVGVLMLSNYGKGAKLSLSLSAALSTLLVTTLWIRPLSNSEGDSF
ncbi:hypothetical protein TNCV_2189921 [Trichonephila clavipes]|nr:hypothetical protein TNCV_2189921 [Trichonephila clavipes]